MVQKNVTEVQRTVETLTMLRTEVIHSKSNTVKAIAEEVRKLETILDEEERLYVVSNCPGANAAVIYDAKLSALARAIGYLEERMLFPKEIVKNLDNAILKLRICITD